MFVDTLCSIEGGSETKLVDVNLQIFLKIMTEFIQGPFESRKFNPKINHLTKSMNSEHCFVCVTPTGVSHIVVGCEAKGIGASIRQCYSQLISVCGNSSLELKRLGLDKDDCVVLGLAMAGSNCQFCAAYLLDPCFPVFVTLTPELNLFGTFEEQLQIATWALKCLDYSTLFSQNLSQLKPPPPEFSVSLDLSGYFLKPIRTIPNIVSQYSDDELPISHFNPRLNHLMRIYELLRLELKDSESISLILFPHGVIAIPKEKSELRRSLIEKVESEGFLPPSNHCPLVLFPFLKDWQTTKPPPQFRVSYLTQVDQVNYALNQSRIAHLDQRPANIMWYPNNEGEVQLRLIDFEDAIVFGHVIPRNLVSIIVDSEDYRYPFQVGDEQTPQYASIVHNEFFRRALHQFVNDSEMENFTDFMQEHGQPILTELLAAPDL